MSVQIKGHQVASGAIANSHIASDAAIDESKLNLNNATHANTNDPSADEKAALAGQGTPSAENPFTTKSYVDGLVDGVAWQAPVVTIHLKGIDQEDPPESPAAGDAYIANGEGTTWTTIGIVWAYDGSQWQNLGSQSVGARFVVDASPDSSLSGKGNQIATIATAEGNDYTWTYSGALVRGVAVSVISPTDSVGSIYEGQQYVYTGESSPVSGWVQIGADAAQAVAAGLAALKWRAPVVCAGLKGDDKTAPPESPAVGDAYIVAANATGDWSGKDGQLLQWSGSAWVELTPTVTSGRFLLANSGCSGTFNGYEHYIATLASSVWTFEAAVDGWCTVVLGGNMAGGPFGKYIFMYDGHQSYGWYTTGASSYTAPTNYEEEVVVASEAKATWELAQTPIANTLKLFVNGSLQRLVSSGAVEGEYTFSTKTATFGVAIPVGEWLFAQYQY